MISISDIKFSCYIPQNFSTVFFSPSASIWLHSEHESQIIIGQNNRVYVWRTAHEAYRPECMTAESVNVCRKLFDTILDIWQNFTVQYVFTENVKITQVDKFARPTVSCQKYSRKMANVKIELSRFGYFELRKK
jgi:hypothetical protein